MNPVLAVERNLRTPGLQIEAMSARLGMRLSADVIDASMASKAPSVC
jgi:hypothetical protein